MQTIIEQAFGSQADLVLEKAAGIIKSGGLVAFPTETVYGLGANGYDGKSALKIYKAKGRPSDNPLILHVSGIEALEGVCSRIPEAAITLAERFWPGPLTLIVPKGDKVPLEVTGGLGTVAVRAPAHETAIALIEKCGVPVAGPSANLSGRPSPTRATHVEFDLAGKIDMIIDGGPCEIGLESTIVDLTGETPVILRPGYISEEDIKSAVKSVYTDVSENVSIPKAPGTKYKHYSPKADLTIVLGEPIKVAKKITELVTQAENTGKKSAALVTEETIHLYKNRHIISLGSSADVPVICQNLFKVLRKLDYCGFDTAYSVGVSEAGLGLAVMNRLLKAAGGKVITV